MHGAYAMIAIMTLGFAVWAHHMFTIGLSFEVYAFSRKERAAANPWGAGARTLEWTLSSPPPFHQFATLPRID